MASQVPASHGLCSSGDFNQPEVPKGRWEEDPAVSLLRQWPVHPTWLPSSSTWMRSYRFDMVSNSTIGLNREFRAASHNGTEEKGFICILTMAVGGTKHQHLSWRGNGTRMDECGVNIPAIHVTVQENGYIQELSIKWLIATFPRENEGLRHLLVWDSCAVHLKS